MTHGFVPELSDWSPYHGAQYAVLLSIAKLVALGGRREDAYLTFTKSTLNALTQKNLGANL